MQNMQNENIYVREGVGIFDDQAQLDAAVSELEMAAFTRHEISVLDTPHAIEEKIGVTLSDPYKLAENPNVPRSVYVLPEERALGVAVLIGGGAYAGAATALLFSGLTGMTTALSLFLFALAGLVLGAGLGAFIAKLMHDKFRKNAEYQVKRGGLVLWVRIFDASRWETARRILKKNGGHYVHLHEIAA